MRLPHSKFLKISILKKISKEYYLNTPVTGKGIPGRRLRSREVINRGRRLWPQANVFKGKGNTRAEGTRVEVRATTLWDYMRLYSRYRQNLKS
jgi:hypothetical protein